MRRHWNIWHQCWRSILWLRMLLRALPPFWKNVSRSGKENKKEGNYMGLADKVVITAALTGVAANRDQCKWIPYTPKEIAEDALACYNAGASVVHIHARENDGSPSWRGEGVRGIMIGGGKRC